MAGKRHGEECTDRVRRGVLPRNGEGESKAGNLSGRRGSEVLSEMPLGGTRKRGQPFNIDIALRR